MRWAFVVGVALAVATFAPTHAQDCDPSYPTVCIPPPPPDLDCGDIDECGFEVTGADPHHLDRDHDGTACECR